MRRVNENSDERLRMSKRLKTKISKLYLFDTGYIEIRMEVQDNAMRKDIKIRL